MSYSLNQSNILRQTLLELHAPHVFNEHYGYIEHEGYRYWKALDKQTGQFIYKKRQLPNGKPEPSTEQEFQSILSQSPKTKGIVKSSKPLKQQNPDQAQDRATSKSVKDPESADQQTIQDSSFSPSYNYFSTASLTAAAATGPYITYGKYRLGLDALLRSPSGEVLYRKYDRVNDSYFDPVPVDPSEFDKVVSQAIKSSTDEAHKYTPLATGNDVLPYLLARVGKDKFRTYDMLNPFRTPDPLAPAQSRLLQYLYGYQEEVMANKPKHPSTQTINVFLKSPEAKDAGIVPKDFKRSIRDFTGDSYEQYRGGSKKDAARELSRQIEALTPKAGFDGGPLFRGISADLDTVKELLKVGHVFDQKGISSWSSELEIACRFSEGGTSQPYQVVFVEASTPKKRALSVSALSSYGASKLGSGEHECLYPDSVKFKVKDFKVVDTGIPQQLRTTILIEVEEVSN